MNEDQLKSGARWVISTFGGMIAGWFAAKGWFTVDQVTSFLNSPVVISGIATLGTLIWGLFAHTDKNKVAAVAALAADPNSPVRAVVVEQSLAGRELVQAVGQPSAVVTAGTPAATTAAH